MSVSLGLMATTEMDKRVPDFVDEKDHDLYWALFAGVRSDYDPVTVRTLLVDSGTLLGLKKPEWETVPRVNWNRAGELYASLLSDTNLSPLIPEFLSALGVEVEREKLSPLEMIVVNGRHTAEPLWSGLAQYAGSVVGRESVAALNPVGHYNDHQPRVAGLAKLLRPVKELAIVASTQTEKGGSLEVLSQTIRLLRDPDFVKQIERVNVILPMFGGSRGHRFGQREGLVYEVMEMISNPKMIGFALMDVIEKVKRELVSRQLYAYFPKIRFMSVDIHNDDLPRQTFQEMGFEFVSVDPSLELAGQVLDELTHRGLDGKRLRVVACDKGAVPRTLRMVERLLKDLHYE